MFKRYMLEHVPNTYKAHLFVQRIQIVIIGKAMYENNFSKNINLQTSSQVGQKMIKDRTFEENSEFFSTVFEIGRRHKILNPECMRTDYGKLIHMLMDSQNPDIQRLLEFKLVKKVKLVSDKAFN